MPTFIVPDRKEMIPEKRLKVFSNRRIFLRIERILFLLITFCTQYWKKVIRNV